jgi:hypothetical protein
MGGLPVTQKIFANSQAKNKKKTVKLFCPLSKLSISLKFYGTHKYLMTLHGDDLPNFIHMERRV